MLRLRSWKTCSNKIWNLFETPWWFHQTETDQYVHVCTCIISVYKIAKHSYWFTIRHNELLQLYNCELYSPMQDIVEDLKCMYTCSHYRRCRKQTIRCLLRGVFSWINYRECLSRTPAWRQKIHTTGPQALVKSHQEMWNGGRWLSVYLPLFCVAYWALSQTWFYSWLRGVRRVFVTCTTPWYTTWLSAILYSVEFGHQ